MRNNFPINSTETIVPTEQYLISKTDLQGKIHYVNPIFEEISGFSRHELIGSDHKQTHGLRLGARTRYPRANCYRTRPIPTLCTRPRLRP